VRNEKILFKAQVDPESSLTSHFQTELNLQAKAARTS